MPLPSSMDATWVNPSSVAYNAQELRRADSALFAGDGTAFGVRGGIVLHGDASLAVSVNASDVVTIQPGAVVIPGNAGVGNGCYRTALGAAETGSLTARNATNPRIDLLIFRVLDTDVVGTHGAFTGRIELLTGLAAAAPVPPALPTLAVELARITVPISGGTAATVDSSFRTYATGLGGRLPVATFARLPTADTKWDTAVALDTGVQYAWSGTAWSPLMISGTSSVTFPAATATSNSLRVNFATPFAAGVVPKVVATSNTVFGAYLITSAIDNAGFTLTGSAPTAPAGATTINVSWIAVP